MKAFFLTALSFFAIQAMSQTEQIDSVDADTMVYRMEMVEVLPEFPGGEDSLLNYLTSAPYPAEAKEKEIEGNVHIWFVVEKSGEVTNFKPAVKGGDKILFNAAVEHIKKMPLWKPGSQKGRKVRVQYVVPIAYRLD